MPAACNTEAHAGAHSSINATRHTHAPNLLPGALESWRIFFIWRISRILHPPPPVNSIYRHESELASMLCSDLVSSNRAKQDLSRESVLESALMRKFIPVTLAVVILSCSVFGLLFLSGHVGSSAARVKREHGLKVPSSARGFICRGDAWMHLFSDSGAASVFEMASRDLPSFVSQLKIQQTNEGGPGSVFPGNAQYQIHRPWMSGVAMRTYRCASPTGDSLAVQFWAIDGESAVVLLYIGWN
jgi:hypothetical protein